MSGRDAELVPEDADPEREAELDAAFRRAVSGIEGFEADGDDLLAELEADAIAAPEPLDEDDWAGRAEDVVAALLERAGEAQPEPRLEPTRRAVELLGDVHRAYPVIHLTGTNGKTSTARIAESLLRAHGLRTGLLTSPHLERLAERIQIDGLPIADERLVANWDDIAPFLALVDAELERDGEPRLTFFEALTVLALACFADAPVDVAVIEVGMGGEWDSTNVVDGEVAVFTPIGMDHAARLGSTIAEIARTKAGIIKPGATVVTAAQEPEAIAELRERAEQEGCALRERGADFDLAADQLAVGGRLISVRGLAGAYDELFLPLQGRHQAENAALAIAAVEALFGGERELRRELVEQGLAEAASPGRLQLIGRRPTVLIDAAHNPHGAHALAAALREGFAAERLVLVVGMLADKDAAGFIRELAPLATHLVVTESDSPRARHAEELAEELGRALQEAAPERRIELDVEPDLRAALDLARGLAEHDGDEGRGAVLVAGSITVIGGALAIAREEGWLRA